MATKVLEVHVVGDSVVFDRAMGSASRSATTAAGTIEAAGLKMQTTGKRMETMGKSISKSVSLPLAAIGVVSAKLAIDFEKSMRNVNSIARLPEPQLKKLEKQVKGLAGPTAQAPKTLAEGLYDLVSSGFKAHESMIILKASAIAASAGLTTTEVSTKAVAAVLNAYHLEAKEAGKVTDDLFEIVNRGVVTFPELAESIGMVLPAAQTMGINLKEVGASIATLTKEGQSGQTAVTNINQAITAFIKPSKGMKAVLKELGFASGEQIINQKGFQGALEAVTNAAGGSKQAIGDMFGNVRAMRAVFGLTGNSAKAAGEDIKGMAHDTGRTAQVFKEQKKSFAFQWSSLKAELEVVGIEIGGVLIPIFRECAEVVKGLADHFMALSPSTQKAIVKAGLLLIALGPVLTVAGKIYKMWGNIASVIGKATDAMGLFTGAEGAGTVAGGAGAGASTGSAAKTVGADVAGTGAAVAGAGILGGRAGASTIASDIPTGAVMKEFTDGLEKVGLKDVAAGFTNEWAKDLMAAAPESLAGIAPEAGGAAGVGGTAALAGEGAAGAGLGAAAVAAAPWVALGAAIAAAGAGIMILYKNSAKFRDMAKPIVDAVTGGFAKAKESVGGLGGAIGELGHAFSGHEGLIGMAKDFFGAIKGPASDAASFLKDVLLADVEVVFADIADVIKGFSMTFEGLVQGWKGIIEVITGILTLNFGKIGHGIKDMFGGVVKEVGGILTGFLGPISNHLKAAGGVIVGVFSKMGTGVWHAVQKIPDLVGDAFKALPHVLGQVVGFWVTLPIRVGAIMLKLRSTVADKLGDLAGIMLKLGGKAMQALWNGVSNAAPTVLHWFASLPGKALDLLSSLPGKLKNEGGSAISGFANGIKGKASAVWSTIKSVVGGGVKAALGLVPKFISAGANIAKEFAGGFADSAGGAFKDAVNGVIGVLNTMIGLVNKLPFVEIGKIGTIGGGGKKQKKAEGGFIVPGQGTGDTFETALPPGSFVMNRKATAHFGLQNGGLAPVLLEPQERVFLPHEVKQFGQQKLEHMNQAVPRFQNGGPVQRLSIGSLVEDAAGSVAGVAREAAGLGLKSVLDSLPDPSSILPSWIGGFGDYLKTELVKWVEGKAPSPASPGPPGGPTGTSNWMGVTVANWVRSSLEYAAKQGVKPQPTSGYRSHAQNVAEGRNYTSEHEFTQYPRGAVDFGGKYGDPAAKANKMAVVQATSGYKWPLLAPIGFIDDGHASGTGHMLGGLVRGFAGGGEIKHSGVLTPEEWAKAMLLGGFPSKPGVIAAGLGTIKSESSFDSSQQGQGPGGHIGGWAESPAFGSVADRLDPVRSSAAAFKEWKTDGGFWQAWGQWEAEQSGLSGGGAGTYGPEYMKTAEAVIKNGVTGAAAGSAKPKTPSWALPYTKSINFPSIPDSLPKVERLLKEWRHKIKAYRREAHKASKKAPVGVAAEIEKNIVAIEKFIRELTTAQHKLHEAIVRKRFSRKLRRALGKITGFDTRIADRERDYEEAEQYAQQLVALEPEQKPGETEAAFIAAYTGYIEGKERPAFMGVLGTEAALRNTILGGETVADNMEREWEGSVRYLGHTIDHSEDYIQKTNEDIRAWKNKHPKEPFPKWLKDRIAERDKMKAALPMQKFQKRELEGTVGAGREAFYGGGKNRINPPAPPMAGSGTFEDSLQSVQGVHWPDQHDPRESMPLSATPTAGVFGGIIFDTQQAIQELGLKIASASEGGGGGEGEGDSEKLQLTEELLAQSRRERAEMEISTSILANLGGIGPIRGQYKNIPWGGRFASGGVVRTLVGENGPEIADLPPGTKVRNAPETAALMQPKVEVINHIYPDHTDTEVRVNGKEIDAIISEVSSSLGASANHRAQGVSDGRVGNF